MEKNLFLMINDLVYEIYALQNIQDIPSAIFRQLHLIIPCEYISLFLNYENNPETLLKGEPICYPESFTAIEREYHNYATRDDLLWILHARESKLVRESDVLDETRRLGSDLYCKCYAGCNIYDTLQLTIVAHQELLGVLTLFRTPAQGAFQAEDMFYLRAIGMHLNAAFYALLHPTTAPYPTPSPVSDIHLTAKETEILNHLLLFEENDEIATALSIKENTLHKHLQNLFRKYEVQSKWELLRKLAQANQAGRR